MGYSLFLVSVVVAGAENSCLSQIRRPIAEGGLPTRVQECDWGTKDHEINVSIESVLIRSEPHRALAQGLVAVVGRKTNKRPRGLLSNKCFAK
jgi:hypothetical protein